MEAYLDKIEYNSVDGTRSERDLVLYSLSTCAFCRTAMEFLKEEGYAFRFIHLDQIDLETKRGAKKELKAKYGEIAVFPVLIIDSERALSGFVPERWREAIEGEAR